jgi:hypothetical protein
MVVKESITIAMEKRVLLVGGKLPRNWRENASHSWTYISPPNKIRNDARVD